MLNNKYSGLVIDCKVDFNILWFIVLGLMVLLIGSIFIILIIFCFLIVILFNLLLYMWYNWGSWFKELLMFEIDEKYLFNILIFFVLVKVILNLFVLDVYCIGGMSFVGFVWKVFLINF